MYILLFFHFYCGVWCGVWHFCVAGGSLLREQGGRDKNKDERTRKAFGQAGRVFGGGDIQASHQSSLLLSLWKEGGGWEGRKEEGTLPFFFLPCLFACASFSLLPSCLLGKQEKAGRDREGDSMLLLCHDLLHAFACLCPLIPPYPKIFRGSQVM